MATKEQIKAIMEKLLETFPKLKENIIDDKALDIRKEKDRWICFIKTKYSQFGDQPGLISTTFNLEGDPIEMIISDFGRPQIAYISKDTNGKYTASEKPDSADL
jgi:hypothetical protein